ncbi:MAG: permease [Candidatus Omnitrophica bacterium]|nr:permease [Candidatus Omnitrophota bacterium]
MQGFIHVFIHYCFEIIPALAIGFFISGLVHEFVPQNAVSKYLGSPGIKPIFYATLIGTMLPVCCWGSLPIAVSFYKKGAKLGPILAFLVATPATSISALLVAYNVLGLGFTVYIFFAVIIMGMAMGLIGNTIKFNSQDTVEDKECPHCKVEPPHVNGNKERTTAERAKSVLRYAYIQLPKEIGMELVAGILLAALVATFVPIGRLINLYLKGWFGYVFAVAFGILMYLCATASTPFIDSLMKQGMNQGAGMTLLLIGPVTSYGTILVLRKKFGVKVLFIFLASLMILTVLAGLGFQMIKG